MSNDVRSKLLSMVPGLEERHFEVTDEPISALMGHALRQGVASAVTILDPDVSHQALASDPTWNDVFAWLERSSAEGQTAATDRPPRGSYRSASTTLRLLGPADAEALYRASLSPRENHRWRFRGRTPGPGDFNQMLYGPEVLSQFMVVEAATNASVGLVVAYDANLTAGHAAVAVQRLLPEDVPPSSRGLMVEGFYVFVQYLFDHFKLSKIYLEVPEYNLSLFEGGAGSLLEMEGRLKDHYYWGDRHWDSIYLALYRDRWNEVADSFRGTWSADHFTSAGSPWKPDL